MRWRVKVEIWKDKKTYIPQYKKFLFWHTCWDHQYTPDNFPIYFDDFEKCRDFCNKGDYFRYEEPKYIWL